MDLDILSIFKKKKTILFEIFFIILFIIKLIVVLVNATSLYTLCIHIHSLSEFTGITIPFFLPKQPASLKRHFLVNTCCIISEPMCQYQRHVISCCTQVDLHSLLRYCEPYYDQLLYIYANKTSLSGVRFLVTLYCDNATSPVTRIMNQNVNVGGMLTLLHMNILV